MRRIVICGLTGSKIFLHILSQTACSWGRDWNEHQTCFGLLYNFCLKNFSFYEKFCEKLSQMYVGLQDKYLLLSDFNEFSQQFFEKPSNTKFHENKFTATRVTAHGLTE